MGLLAVKHMDPVVGVDVHAVIVAPSPTPVFLPHPHVGFVLDLREYVSAAMGVVGSIATTIVQEKAIEYLQDHPDVPQQIDQATNAVGDKLNDIESNAIVAEGLKLDADIARMEGAVANASGAGVGAGGGGGPIFVNGFMRTTAGTHSFHVPGLHFPLGESFAPVPPAPPEPSNDAEAYMGSRTVLANNDPMSFMALPAMSCWSVGEEPIAHNGAHTQREYPSMPSSVMLPIPVGRPVLVGGPPVMNMAAAAAGLFKAFKGSKWAYALADKLHLKPGFLRCNVLRAEPVDVTTGEVVVQQRDFTVPGRLPLVWDRYYASHDTYPGAVGVGWQTPADIRLELMSHESGIGAAACFPDHATAFDALPVAEGWSERVYDWQHGHALYRCDDRLTLRTRGGIQYRFDLPPRWQQIVSMLEGGARLTLPVERIADLNGNAWVFERDERGHVVRVAEWTCDGATARTIECDRRDSGYDRLSGVKHAAGITGLTLIDADGGAHLLVTYEHDRDGNLSAAVDAMAHPHRFDYADNHRMVSHTSARGVSFYYRYCAGEDGVWRVDRAWGDDGVFDYRFTYDRVRMETRITDSRGHTSVLQLNERGMPVATIDSLGGVTNYRYDAQGRANAKTDPSGSSESWEYDQHGNLVAQTQPDGSTIRTEYDAAHRPICVTLPDRRQWRYEWDASGNLLVQTAPTGAMSRYAYDRHGEPVAHTGPCGALTQFEYDCAGNLTVMTDALGHRTRYRHDARGNLIEVIDALGQTSHYEYDRIGNLTRAIEAGRSEVLCQYDADRNLVRYRDSAGNLTQMDYSPLGKIIKRRSPDGTVVEYRYDTEEQLIGVVNERGELYRFERDALGRIVEEVDYWGQARRYEYGPLGGLQRSIDPAGQTITYRIDPFRRVVQKQVPDPRQDDGFRIETFEYDSSGRLVIAANPDTRIELCYDDLGRLVEERQGDDFTIAYRYDAAGQRIERRTQLGTGGAMLGHVVRYDYDEFGAATSIQIDDAVPVTLERDALGRVCVEHLGEALRRELTYAPDGELARQALLGGTGLLFATEYTYDANGEMIAKRDSRLGVERFEYDPVGKLTGHLDPTGKLQRLMYDPAGDLLKTRVRQGNLNGRLEHGPQTDSRLRDGEHGGSHYTFDHIGNLLRKQDAQQDLILRWDGDGLLIETLSVRQAVGSAAGALHIHTRYVYDVFHRRTRKTTQIRGVSGPTGGPASGWVSGSRTRCFIWEGDTLVAEIASGDERVDRLLAGAATTLHPERENGSFGISPLATDASFEAREWVCYPGTFRPLAQTRCVYRRRASHGADGDMSRAAVRLADCALVSEMRHVFHNDPNGAPVRLTDRWGATVWEGRYTAWGHASPGEMKEAFDQPLRFQGQYYDTESGLHFNRYRYYDPAIGQFISPDPIRLLGGANLYAYAPNGLGWSDPLGLSGNPIKPKPWPYYFGHPISDTQAGVRAAVADYLDNHPGLKSSGGKNVAAVQLHDGTFDVLHGGDTATGPGHPERELLERHKGSVKVLWTELQPCTPQYLLRAAGNKKRNRQGVQPCSAAIEAQGQSDEAGQGLEEVWYFMPHHTGENAAVRKAFRGNQKMWASTTLDNFRWPWRE